MNMRDAQILNARKKPYYCNLLTQVHHNCEHGNSKLSSELPSKPKQPQPIQSDGKQPNPNCYTVMEFESGDPWPISEYREFSKYHLARCSFCNPALINN